MDKAKRELLQVQGWKVGTVAEFLELTPDEAALIEIKLATQSKPARTAGKTDDTGRTG